MRLGRIAATLAYPAVILFALAAALAADNRPIRIGDSLVTASTDAVGWFSIAILLLLVARGLQPVAEYINWRLRGTIIRRSRPTSYNLEPDLVWPAVSSLLSGQEQTQFRRASARLTWALGATDGTLLAVPLSCLLLLGARHVPWLLFTAPASALLLWALAYRRQVIASEYHLMSIQTGMIVAHRFELYRLLHMPMPATLTEELVQNAALMEALTGETDLTVNYDHRERTGSSAAEIRGVVEKAVYDSLDASRTEPALANWSGQVGMRIAAEDGNSPPSLEPGQPYQLVVAFGRGLTDEFERRNIDVRGGRHADPVAFELLLDSDKVMMPADGQQIDVPVDGGLTTRRYSFFAPSEPGEFRLWVQVLQLNRVLQVVTVTARADRIQSP